MATFYAMYPPSSGSSSNASVGVNGSPIPADSTLVGGENPSGNLQPLQTDVSGNLLVSITSSGTDQNVNLDKVGGAAITEGQKTMSTSLPVVIASDQSTLPVSAASLPLPTGAATSANQTNASQKTQIVDGSGNVIASTSNALNVNVSSSGLSNQSVNLAQIAGTTTLTGNGTAGAGAQRVTIASDNTAFSVNATLQAGSALAGKVGIDQTTPGTTNAIALAQIGSTTTAAGNGVAGAGVQRVAIASDNTAFSVNAVQSGNWSTRTQDGSGNAITSTTTALDVNIKSSGLSNQSVNLAQVGGASVALGQAANASSIPVALSNEDVQDLFFTGQSAQTATVNNIIPASSGSAATDATGYRSGSIQVVSSGTGGTFIFEGSNDNSSFVTIPIYNQAVVSGASIIAAITATSSQIIYTFPINFRYLRLRIASTITGGSIQAFTKLSQSAWAPFLQLTSSPVTSNVNAIQSGAWFTTATATLSNVASSASSVTVLASNSSRKGMMVFNDSTAVLYLKFGATASATSYTVQIASNGYYELPNNPYAYTGIMDGIWSAANGNARVTEIT